MCHHSQSPPDVSVHSRETCFPCTASTFKPRIDSLHSGTWDSPVGKPRGKASWESLLGKPRGKATDPLIHAKSSVTLLLQLERRDPFTAWSGKNSRCSRRISRGGPLHRKGERNSRVVPPFPEFPRCPSPFQGNLFSLHCLHFQAEDRLTTWWHVGQPCLKASWESLLGKPRWKATDPLIHANGSAALLPQLGRKAHVHAPTRDED